MNEALTYNETELLFRISEGDENAFAAVFDRYQDTLARFIYGITKSQETAREIVQDVFMKIWMTRETLAGIGNFKSFLFAVSQNHAINALNKQIRERKRLTDLQAAGEAHPSIDPHESNAIIDTRSEQILDNYLSLIDKAIDQLAPQQKRAWIMSRREHKTYEEIGEALKISKTTVKTHIQHAVAAISKYVRENEPSLLPLLVIMLSH